VTGGGVYNRRKSGLWESGSQALGGIRHWKSGLWVLGIRKSGRWKSGSQGMGDFTPIKREGHTPIKCGGNWGISPHRKSAFEQMRAGGN